MCKFVFYHQNGQEYIFEHIKRVEYINSSRITVSEKDLLTHNFPMNRELYLYSDDCNYTIHGNSLIFIKVQNEL